MIYYRKRPNQTYVGKALHKSTSVMNNNMRQITTKLANHEALQTKMRNTVGCAFPTVVVSILPHGEFGRNDHREHPLHFKI